jgi:hypothetical protein
MMEEAGTATRVDAHNGYDLLAGSAIGQRSGVVGNAVDLPGAVNGWLYANTQTEKHNITGDWSAACWINMDTLPTYSTIFGLITDGNPGPNWGYTLFLAGSTLTWYVMSGATFPSATITVSTATNYCVYVEYNSATGELGLSVDDATLITTAVGTPNTTTTKILYCGTWSGLARYANCMLDELAIWKGRILTPAERTEYNTGVTYTGL